MGVLHQSRGKGYAASRVLEGMTTASRVANRLDESAEFELMHDVAQRPQFGGLTGALGVTSAGVPIQAKMMVGEAGDRYEQEADRLAPQIVRQINAPGFGEQLYDSQPEIQEDTPSKQVQALRPTLQLKGESTGGVVSSEIESAIASARGGGRSLEPGLQEQFGQAMGADFSRVRIHTDAQANALNLALGSRAFTTTQNIFFGYREYQPRSQGGQELIAHELTHIVQQERSSSTTSVDINSAHIHRKIGFEFEAGVWRVRDLSEVDPRVKKSHETELHKWTDEIHRRLLMGIARNPEGHPLKMDGDKEFCTGWFDNYEDWNYEDPSKNRLTPAGRTRIGIMVKDPQYKSKFDDLVRDFRIGNSYRDKPLLGKNLDKNQKIVEAEQYTLTADSSPSGGSNLEWVTEPLSSREDVKRVLTNLTAMVHQFNKFKDDEVIYLDKLSGIAGGGRLTSGGFVVYPGGGEMTFEPQTSVGMKIGYLSKLLHYLHDQRDTNESRSAFQIREQAKHDLFRSDLDKLVKADTRAQKAITEFQEEIPRYLESVSTKELRALITLLVNYLTNANDLPDRSNAKSIAQALLVRTDFAHNFKLLPEPYQVFFSKKPEIFVDLVLFAAEMQKQGNEKIYSGTVESGYVDEREVFGIPLTRQMWLENIPKGIDLLKTYPKLSEEAKQIDGVTEEGWSPIHPSLGALGSVDDTVGSGSIETKALVIEFRRMGNTNVEEKDLKPLALAIYDLIEQLHKNQKLEYKKRKGWFSFF